MLHGVVLPAKAQQCRRDRRGALLPAGFNGLPHIAAQVMKNERVKFDAAGRPLEAVLLGDRQHAGLVRVIGYAVIAGGWCPHS